MITVANFVRLVLDCYQNGVKYWYGTCWYPCTENLLASKASQRSIAPCLLRSARCLDERAFELLRMDMERSLLHAAEARNSVWVEAVGG